MKSWERWPHPQRVKKNFRSHPKPLESDGESGLPFCGYAGRGANEPWPSKPLAGLGAFPGWAGPPAGCRRESSPRTALHAPHTPSHSLLPARRPPPSPPPTSRSHPILKEPLCWDSFHPWKPFCRAAKAQWCGIRVGVARHCPVPDGDGLSWTGSTAGRAVKAAASPGPALGCGCRLWSSGVLLLDAEETHTSAGD